MYDMVQNKEENVKTEAKKQIQRKEKRVVNMNSLDV